MKTPHIVNFYYALFLILIGLFGFFVRYYTDGDLQITSLIPSFFGFVLLFFTKGIKADNAVIAHIAVTLTLILAFMVTFMFFKNLSAEFTGSRKFYIFMLTGIVSYLALAIYIAGFIDKKKNRQD